ncbi:type III-A CRISPR-associated protein Csm2 [Leptothoe sp. ISB3NOV94-8A]
MNYKSPNRNRTSPAEEISKEIEKYIESKSLKSLKEYPVRDLVKHAEKLGPVLRQQRLETNQIRKFLDAINQLKARLITSSFNEIEADIILLKPKLAYAATRQNAVEPLKRVMTAAIEKTRDEHDFKRLVQLIESIIAYHKAAGGK